MPAASSGGDKVVHLTMSSAICPWVYKVRDAAGGPSGDQPGRDQLSGSGIQSVDVSRKRPDGVELGGTPALRPGARLREAEGVDHSDRRRCPRVKEIEEACDQAVVTGELVTPGTAASEVVG
jgi:hypothetical protein